MSKNSFTSILNLKQIVLIALLFIFSSFVFSAWQAPSSGSISITNTDAPINKSSTAQLKQGGLSVASLQVVTGSIFEGIVILKELLISPSTISNYGQVYFKDDHKLYKMDSNGVEEEIGSGGGLFVDGVDTNEAVYTNGNVGIATSDPKEKLQVDGNILVSSPNSNIYSIAMERTDESSQKHKWAMIHMNDAYGRNNLSLYEYHDTNDTGSYCDGDTCTSRLVVKAGGNLGIGTTNPEEKLQVNGRISIQSGDPTIVLRDTNNRSAMIHNNSNRLYFLRGSANDSATWAQYNGMWPLYLDLENNQGIFGGSLGIHTIPTGALANHKAIAFGDGDTGIRQNGEGRLEFVANGSVSAYITSNELNLNGHWLRYAWMNQDRTTGSSKCYSRGDGNCNNGYYMAGIDEHGDGLDSIMCCRP